MKPSQSPSFDRRIPVLLPGLLIRNRFSTLFSRTPLLRQNRGPTLGTFWRCRVGDYRLICDIQDAVLLILVIEMGNRRDVYR